MSQSARGLNFTDSEAMATHQGAQTIEGAAKADFSTACTESRALKKPKSIHDLPLELLLIILKHVYMHSRRATRCEYSFNMDWSSAHLTELWIANETKPYDTDWDTLRYMLTSPSLFPYAHISVCKTWRRAMTLVPAFWTRMVVFVDSEVDQCSLVSQLEWAKGLPFHVHLVRHEPPLEVSASLEAQRVAAAMKVLKPHLFRCLKLDINVTHQSSLPSLLDLPAGSYSFKNLSLHCEVADQSISGHDTPDSNGDTDLICDELNDLELDGHNFLMTIPRMNTLQTVTSLSIAHFNPAGWTTCPLEDLLNVLPMFTALESFSLIDFHSTPMDADFQGVVIDRYELSVVLKDLPGQVLADFLVHTTLSGTGMSLEIDGCSLANIAGVILPDAMMLSFSNISNIEAVGPYLEAFIGSWEGMFLYLSSCGTFTNTVIRILGEHGLGNPLTLCTSVESIEISFCPELDLDLLLQAVKCRNLTFSKDKSKLRRRSGTATGVIGWLNVSGTCPPIDEQRRGILDYCLYKSLRWDVIAHPNPNVS
ncbi:hypothetical protein HGRIS_000719 [Hohenbuehelia grisea]|uniref:F-box domain-containing protein n=1 Tax=Hohenbuehelia grisea TaxID=104357 RepID=A0ABR3IPI6_9AGAR